VARHIFQACSVWIYTQSNITGIINFSHINFYFPRANGAEGRSGC
jgi:hypothetical protein